MLKQIAHSSRADAVVTQILELMKQGRLRPGDKLPSEPELVRMLNVGRSSIREAKQILATRKLIETRAGQGSFVRRVRSAELMDGDILYLLLADETLSDLQETREVLEIDLVGFAAERATAADLDAIAATLSQIRAAIPDRQSVFEAGLTFHRSLIDAAHNQVVVTIYRTIQALLETYQRPIYTERHDPEADLREHTAIYEAVKAGDAQRARLLMREHLAGVRALTFDHRPSSGER